MNYTQLPPQLWAVLGFYVAWAIWCVPFVRQRAANKRSATKGRETAVTERVSMWGIGLEGLAYAMVWSIQTIWKLPFDPVRVAIAAAFALLGIVTVWSAVPALGKQWRLQAGLNADHQLVKTGAYRYVRHPIYAAMFAMLLSSAILITSWPVMIAAVAVFIIGTEIRVRAEDRLLAGRFGAEFEVYRATLKAYIPFVR